mgnify:CR=1 FL=1
MLGAMGNGKLILVRHGQSEWNKSNQFTGWVDVDLTEQGEAEAVNAGKLLVEKHVLPDVLFTSLLRRAIRTANIALLHYYDKKTGRKSRRGPQFAKKGMKIIALIETTAPVCLERFRDYAQLGRFTLRDEGKTVAIGKVTKLLSDDDVPNVGKLSIN